MQLRLLGRVGWLELSVQGSAHWSETGMTPTRARWGVYRRIAVAVGRSSSSLVWIRRSALCALYMSCSPFVGAVLTCPLPGLLAPNAVSWSSLESVDLSYLHDGTGL
jgi:hypothetical protein